MTSLISWQDIARKKLIVVTETPQLESSLMLVAVLKVTQEWLITHENFDLSREQIQRLENLMTARLRGKPLPYILGRWPFYGRDFIVSPGVLIPRPETELMVEEALGWLKQNPGRRVAADVGTGSGCIAITLAAEIPDLNMTAIEISTPALEVSAKNIRAFNLQNRINLRASDLLNNVSLSFDLICANLPYIPTGKLAKLPVAAHEPRLALDGGPDGLRIIRHLIGQIPARLNPGGLVLLEIEAGQGWSALELAGNCLPGWKALVLADYSGRPRLLRIEKKAE
jgi:release factor glutamine methyltransferase